MAKSEKQLSSMRNVSTFLKLITLIRVTKFVKQFKIEGSWGKLMFLEIIRDKMFAINSSFPEKYSTQKI